MKYTFEQTKLTNNDINDTNPHIAGNGDISWERESSENNHNIWYYGAENEASRAIANNPSNETDPYISSQEEKTYIVYEREMGAENTNIYYWNSEGVNTVVADTPNNETNPEVYGDYVVYEYESTPENKDIYLYNQSNETTIEIANSESNEYNAHLFGDYVIYESESSAGNTDIYRYDITNGETTEIATTANGETNAQVWGNGHVVYEYQSGNNNSDIRYYDNITGQTVTLADSIYNETHGDIAGQYIAWQGWDGNDWEVYRYDIASQTTERLTDNDVNDYAPEVSADGYVVYQHDVSENNSDIYLYTDTGTLTLGQSQYNETNYEIYGSQVTWQAWDGNDWEVYAAEISQEV
jgi:beta propeller repeat protein